VRGKGVMEKCTFCVQRIREAENARRRRTRVEPDEFTTACARRVRRAPSRSATRRSRMVGREAGRDRRAYHVFEELNTYTAVVY
jgi:molybdopterin-containing oxidoreductase family iron-sulfur binding subunit